MSKVMEGKSSGKGTEYNCSTRASFRLLALLLLAFLGLLGVSRSLRSLPIQAELTRCDSVQKEETKETTSIPRQIFLFWDNGFMNAPPLTKMIKQLAHFQNPHYKFYLLNATTADELSGRKEHVPDSLFKPLRIQGQSDIYRTLLIYKYGGIWMDATLQANRPFDEWLNLDSPDLISFQRLDNAKQQASVGITPWITSWFLAAPPKSFMMTQIFHALTDSVEQARFGTHYNWWHRMVSDVAHTNKQFRKRLKSFASAGDQHCFQDGWRQAPVNKRCKQDLLAPIFAVTKLHCCGDNTPPGGILQHVCEEWNCHTMLVNEDIVNTYKRAIKEAFGGVLPSIDSWDRTSPACVAELAEGPCNNKDL